MTKTRKQVVNEMKLAAKVLREEAKMTLASGDHRYKVGIRHSISILLDALTDDVVGGY